MSPVLWFLPFLLFAAATPTTASLALPGCQSKCGDVEIPYPFGIADGCFLRRTFRVVCNTTFNQPRLFSRGLQIASIDVARGEARGLLTMSSLCFDPQGNSTIKTFWRVNLTLSTFRISDTRNHFYGTGCNTLAFLRDTKDLGFSTGCISTCSSMTNIDNGTCSGIGCCETSLPEGLRLYSSSIRAFNNLTQVRSFNPCSYAFVAEKGAFSFDTSFINSSQYASARTKQPVALDWAIRGASCEEAKRNVSAYACRSPNSKCVPVSAGIGYLCNCFPGYEGNAYLPDGCQDINECKSPDLYPCNGVCANTPGSYKCDCKPGFHADDAKKEKCMAYSGTNGFPLGLKIGTGLAAGVLFLLIAGSWTYWWNQKRKLMNLKHKFFQQNGGMFLQQQISSHQASTFKIFTISELQKATNNFDQERILGKGGYGTVYKGLLDDQRVVAIKKSIMVDESRNKEFAREMLILSQVNHVNVVKLLGCCLEVEVPMLVYEYIPNGTLFHYLHVKRFELSFPLSARLRIATEAADALYYLHSAASPPILHGDVKSSNILLDVELRAKVSDFGTSVLAPNDKAQFTTMVQGTCGYLDPEYMQTCQLTEKSDVYSFGVVLVELLTGKKALYFSSPDTQGSLAQNFISCMKAGRLVDILDVQIVGGDGLTRELILVAELAFKCLSLSGDDRPTMKEVVMELEAVRKAYKHMWARNEGELQILLNEATEQQVADVSTGFVSLDNRPLINIEEGR